MRIFLIIILIFVGTAQCAVPTYGLQPSESEYLEGFNSEEETEISKEKENIMESIAPAREEREKNLHPFVETVRENTESPFDYALKANAPIEPERKTPYIKAPISGIKPNTGINFLFILIILAAFLSAYFFIKPKSR